MPRRCGLVNMTGFGTEKDESIPQHQLERSDGQPSKRAAEAACARDKAGQRHPVVHKDYGGLYQPLAICTTQPQIL